MATSHRILVTGATGYIASRLIPRLLKAGYRVRVLARRPRQLEGRAWFEHVEVFSGDVMDLPTLEPALEGVHTAYYLIHNMSSGHGYTERELVGASNFARAAANADIQHIIYLGGLADPEQHIAPHMRSRIETGIMLRKGKVPVTEFRASVIAGSGSISFEMIRFMTELFPIVPGPAWFKNKSQPIAVQNVIDYLLAALTNPNGRGHVFEVGGPQVTRYKDLILTYARVRGLKRRMIILPYIPVWFMALGVSLVTPVPFMIAYALISGLSADSVVKHPEGRTVFPEVNLIDFESAARDALDQLHPAHVERVWEDGRGGRKSLKHEGFFILQHEVKTQIPPENLLTTLSQEAVKKGWHLESSELEKRLLIGRSLAIGKDWIEWRVAGRTIRLTSYFAPWSLGGFLYWIFRFPFQSYKLNRMLKGIVRQRE